jgi:Skp family chaperone for outer membrane proteins
MKRMISMIFIILAVVFTLPLGAEQITKVAVLDYTRILSSFYADSAEARRIEELKNSLRRRGEASSRGNPGP